MRTLACLAAALAVAAWCVAGVDPCLAEDGAPRVVAVGDVHGDSAGLAGILTAAGLVDDELHWTGGRSILVQTGDLLDRGTDVRGVMDLLMRLQRESREAGGRVICLLGNHEALNLLGIRREVNPDVYAQFANRRSKARRRSAWREQVRVWERRVAMAGKVMIDVPEETREAWQESFPPGAFEYVDALGPEGDYGRWLRSCPVAVLVQGTLFVHGGLSPTFAGLGVDEMNHRAAAELAIFEAARSALVERSLAEPWAPIEEVSVEAEQEIARLSGELGDGERKPEDAAYLERLQAVLGWRDWVLMAKDGPLWTRALTDWDEDEHQAEVEELLSGVGARRVVSGHTPQASARIHPRFGNRVFLIDTGMLRSEYGGRPSALEICGEEVTAVYLDERQVLVDARSPSGGTGVETPPAPVPQSGEESPGQATGRRYRWLDVDGDPLPFQDDARIERFLATADVVSTEPIPVGVTRPVKLTLEQDGVRAHAAFKDVNERHRYVSLEVLGRQRMFRMIRDYHLFDCAAYRLDRLLGLDRFPPAVPRKVGGRSGTVTLWLENVIMEKQRRDRNLTPPDPESLEQQRAIQYVFDNIVGNTDSTNVGNALFDRWWELWFIDCSRCFVTESKPLTLALVTRCERTLWKRLHEVSDEEIRTTLAPYLNRAEIDDVIRRRAAVVEHLAALIADRGESAVLYDLTPSRAEATDW